MKHAFNTWCRFVKCDRYCRYFKELALSIDSKLRFLTSHKMCLTERNLIWYSKLRLVSRWAIQPGPGPALRLWWLICFSSSLSTQKSRGLQWAVVADCREAFRNTDPAMGPWHYRGWCRISTLKHFVSPVHQEFTLHSRPLAFRLLGFQREDL